MNPAKPFRSVYSVILFVLAALFMLSSCSSGGGASFTASVNYTPPSQKANGDPLSLSEITGYRVYYGEQSGEYTSTVNLNASGEPDLDISIPTSGTYFVVVTTLANGLESSYSEEVIVTF